MPSFEWERVTHYSILLDGCSETETVPDVALNVSSLTLIRILFSLAVDSFTYTYIFIYIYISMVLIAA